MSLASLVRLLEEGTHLSRYEATAKLTGKLGEELEREVEGQIPEWYAKRKMVESTLRFGHDAHYAALNVGGKGAARHGVCCVVLDPAYWLPRSTCFGGDSLLSCFSKEGRQVLDESEILSRFSVGEDYDKMAVVTHHAVLRAQRERGTAVDLQALRSSLEDSENLVEFHLHGQVEVSQIVRVIMPRDRHDSLWGRVNQFETEGRPETEQFDSVRYFMKANQLLDLNHIPLVIAEGS
jgi:hypothetical protein